MRTIDRIRVHAPYPRVFAAASAVARWPSILPHYRWVRLLDGGLVEMAAWRPFASGLIKYPTWWVSEMTVDRPAGEIRYTHVRGITRGMQVVWKLVEDGEMLEVPSTWRSCTPGPDHAGRSSAGSPPIWCSARFSSMGSRHARSPAASAPPTERISGD